MQGKRRMLQVRDPGGILSFTPDKGEADGSNPSGPTSVFPGQKPFSAVRDTRPKAVFLKAVSKFRRLDPDQIGLPAGVSRSRTLKVTTPISCLNKAADMSSVLGCMVR
jgi:hypothetical protein